MANWSELKDTVDDVIKPNGINSITGANHQSTLFEVVTQLGMIHFRGIATPQTTSDIGDRVGWYLADIDGTYNNLGGAVLLREVAAIAWNGTGWAKHKICDRITWKDLRQHAQDKLGGYNDLCSNSIGDWIGGHVSDTFAITPNFVSVTTTANEGSGLLFEDILDIGREYYYRFSARITVSGLGQFGTGNISGVQGTNYADINLTTDFEEFTGTFTASSIDFSIIAALNTTSQGVTIEVKCASLVEVFNFSGGASIVVDETEYNSDAQAGVGSVQVGNYYTAGKMHERAPWGCIVKRLS